MRNATQSSFFSSEFVSAEKMQTPPLPAFYPIGFRTAIPAEIASYHAHISACVSVPRRISRCLDKPPPALFESSAAM
jgi:hypothetical protein